VQIETAKNNLQITKLEREAEIKRQLMEVEFNFNMELTKAKGAAEAQREKEIEDRKDKRTRISGSQQSQMIDQRKNDTLPINFESAGNDTLGGFGLEQFTPQ